MSNAVSETALRNVFSYFTLVSLLHIINGARKGPVHRFPNNISSFLTRKDEENQSSILDCLSMIYSELSVVDVHMQSAIFVRSGRLYKAGKVRTLYQISLDS